jgi:hypothetical protein
MKGALFLGRFGSNLRDFAPGVFLVHRDKFISRFAPNLLGTYAKCLQRPDFLAGFTV